MRHQPPCCQMHDKGPLDTQHPPEKLDDCMRRYRASQASKTSIPIQAARVTIAHRCSESRGHSTTHSSTSFGPLSGPPPSSANHRPSPPTQTREAQHCRLPPTSLHGWPRLATPSKRTFLSLCPLHGPSSLVGRGSRCALLPCVSPRAGGMVVSAPSGQLSPSCGRTPSSHET